MAVLKEFLKQENYWLNFCFSPGSEENGRNNEVTVLIGCGRKEGLHSTNYKITAISFFCRYDEVCDFNFSDYSSRDVTGHFTQVVWKASTQLGSACILLRSCGRLRLSSALVNTQDKKDLGNAPTL